MEKITTKEEFSQFVENNKEQLALVDFHASWCSPCRLLGQIFDEIFPIDGVVVGGVDLDEADEEIAAEHGVRNIPTVLFFKNGLQIDRFTGMIGREALENKIKENLEK